MHQKTLYVSAGIIWNKQKLLVAKRPKGKPYSGFWEFPGGKIETDETSEEALKRELFEELDIDVTMSVFWKYKKVFYEQTCVHLYFYHVLNYEGDVKGKEDQEIDWILPSKLLEKNLLPANVFLIDELILYSSGKKD